MSATLKPITKYDALMFLNEASNYFAKRPTGGEDKAHWANVFNSENCLKVSALIESMDVEIVTERTRINENLISVIADIRMKSGLGAKPMLFDLADAIAQAILAAEERGMKRGLERAAEIAEAQAQIIGALPHSSIHASLVLASSAILSEITPSARSSSRASEAGSSDTSTGDPAPIHDEASK